MTRQLLYVQACNGINDLPPSPSETRLPDISLRTTNLSFLFPYILVQNKLCYHIFWVLGNKLSSLSLPLLKSLTSMSRTPHVFDLCFL